MRFAVIVDNTPEELLGDQILLPTSAAWISRASLLTWDEEDRNAEGVWTIQEPTPPVGYITASQTLGLLDGVPTFVREFEPAPPPPVPEAVDFRQACLKLDSEPHGEGTRLDAVEAFVATQPRSVRIEWERARELRRDHPMVGIMGLFFGQTSEDLDQWFREAAAIGPTLAL